MGLTGFAGRICAIALSVLAVLAVPSTGIPQSSYDPANSGGKVRVAVFPFPDLSRSVADMRITSLIAAELATRDFIRIISPEVIRRRVLDLEPAYFEAGKDSSGNPAGIVYGRIASGIVEEVARNTDANFSVTGDISWFNTKWIISAHVAEVRDRDAGDFRVSGVDEEELPGGIEEIATEIAVFIRDGAIVPDVEEEVRKYLGGIYSLSTVVSKVETLSLAYQDSLPLQAVLLDLYLRDRAAYRGKIAATASKVIALYDPAHGSDTRYLLSLSLDPFDVLARLYEENREWSKAIEVRKKSLEVFSFYAEKHRAGIARDKKKLNARKAKK